MRLSTPYPARLNTGQAAQQRSLRLLALLALGWLPVILGRSAVESAAKLYPLAEGPHPYFVPQYALLLYVWTPLVVLSGCILLLSPGLLLSLALNRSGSVTAWVLHGLAFSIPVVSVAAVLAQAVIGEPLRGGAFVLVVVLCALLAFGVFQWRLARGFAPAWPFRAADDGITALVMCLVPALILAALTPKFYRESSNGDGAQAFETARLLLFRPLPFWPADAGELSAWPGVTSMLHAFPASWFIRLFGGYEVAVRVPYLLYLAALYAAIVELSAALRPRMLSLAERLVAWLPLCVFTVVLLYSATYSPYSADIALPATQDTLMMVCFLGYVLAFVRGQRGWLLLFGSFASLSLPTGLLMISLWSVTALLVLRPRPWRLVGLSAGLLLAWSAIGTASSWILPRLGQPAPGQEYGALGFLRYLEFLQWSDWRRVLFVIVPAGILPALALLAWPWQDRVSRGLTLTTVVYFLFFYVQAYTVLHHFIPAMILPLVVFWRTLPVNAPRARVGLVSAAGAAAVVSLMLSLPVSFRPDVHAREAGAAVEDRLGGYDRMEPAVFRRSELLVHLFPYEWDAGVPDRVYGGSPVAWNYYAHRPADEKTAAYYVLQPQAQTAPEGAMLVATGNDAALYVTDTAAWAQQRAYRPFTVPGSPLYAIPRGMVFRTAPYPSGVRLISVADVLARLGIEVEPLLRRLGAIT